MNGDHYKENHILLGRVKKINPVRQKKGDVINIITLTDFIYEEIYIKQKKQLVPSIETNLTSTKSKESKKGNILFT
jgi:hypothetical protein